MTREEAINYFERSIVIGDTYVERQHNEALKMAIKALEQEPRKDEIILTKKEYGELVSSEFDNGYAKGYREALEQESVLDKLRGEIMDWQTDIHDNEYDAKSHDFVFEGIYEIIDEYKTESEDKE